MQQQINLYQERFHIIKPKGPGLMLWAPVAAILILALISGYEYWKSIHLTETLAGVTQQYEQLQAEMDGLQLSIKQRGKDPALEKTLQRLDRELRRKNKSLELLQGGDGISNKQGLSNYLQALSETDQEALWLEDIAITNGGRDVSLRGKTLNPEEVPVYLQDLGRFAVYQDKAFSSFILARDEAATGVNHFLLSTRPGVELELEAQP